jgi:hypothetical protein
MLICVFLNATTFLVWFCFYLNLDGLILLKSCSNLVILLLISKGIYIYIYIYDCSAVSNIPRRMRSNCLFSILVVLYILLPKLYSPRQCQSKVLFAKPEKAKMEFQEVVINQKELGNF